jgi:hypothetical protein
VNIEVERMRRSFGVALWVQVGRDSTQPPSCARVRTSWPWRIEAMQAAVSRAWQVVAPLPSPAKTALPRHNALQ